MILLDNFKARATLWILKAFSDEKYWARRWFLVKFCRSYLNNHIFETEGGEGMEEGKSKWKSKTVWAAIITAIVGAIEPISTAFGNPIHVPEWVISALIAIGLYGIRDAIGKNTAIK